jgi:hypothetical protein
MTTLICEGIGFKLMSVGRWKFVRLRFRRRLGGRGLVVLDWRMRLRKWGLG